MANNNKNYYKNHNGHNNGNKFYYKNNKKHNNKQYYYHKNNKKQDVVINEQESQNNILLQQEPIVEKQINQQQNQEIENSIKQDNTVRVTLQEDINSDYEELEFVPVKKSESPKFRKKGMFKYALGALIIVALIFGASYSFFTYTKEDTRQADIYSGEVYVKIEEEAVNLTLSRMYPRTNEEARSRSDNYIDFTLKGKNTSETKEINYVLNITNGADVQGKTRINPQYLLIDLQEKVGNEYTFIKNAVPLSTFSFSDVVPVNTTSEITKEYRLRIWVSDAIIISDTEQNRTYTQAEFSNLYANVHVEVNSIDQNHVTTVKETIEELSSSKNYIASYDDVIAEAQTQNLTFTTQDQVSTSATKQTVYYYTGNDAAANANVVFAGYCWQIIRTTDNGGVKMIYNGVATKPVTTSTPITNTDITYTNDATYAYTYDSSTKKWTSANAGVASTTDTFTFTVNTSGDYAINYTVSSQANNDIAKFYINNVLLGHHSGEEEGVFDLGTLSTTDTVKIEYTKDANTNTGNDNIVFDIASVTGRGTTQICSTERRATKGINGTNAGTSTSLSSANLFGRSYNYNLTTGQFTIEDSVGLPTAWSENDSNNNGKKDYEELIGAYTCKSNSSTCTTLYYVGSYASSTNAYTASYTIGDVAHYSQMGKSAFNANYGSPALVGYMFNKEYDYESGSKSGEYYTNAVWENGAYTLSSGNSGTSPDATHHYICDIDCTKVRYYFYGANYYILLENGKTVEDALKEMINYKANANDSDENINVYNSAIKGYLDNWYKKNLTAYASYLDNETVYCNDRSVRDLGGWNPSGTRYLQFYQYSANRDLSCVNETDRFSKSNNKAKLDYPIGLLSEPERNLMADNFAKIGQYYWTISPNYFFNPTYAYVRNVYTSGGTTYSVVGSSIGARGVVSLKPGTLFDGGTGTYDDPYIVGPIVER